RRLVLPHLARPAVVARRTPAHRRPRRRHDHAGRAPVLARPRRARRCPPRRPRARRHRLEDPAGRRPLDHGGRDRPRPRRARPRRTARLARPTPRRVLETEPEPETARVRVQNETAARAEPAPSVTDARGGASVARRDGSARPTLASVIPAAATR